MENTKLTTSFEGGEMSLYEYDPLLPQADYKSIKPPVLVDYANSHIIHYSKGSAICVVTLQLTNMQLLALTAGADTAPTESNSVLWTFNNVQNPKHFMIHIKSIETDYEGLKYENIMTIHKAYLERIVRLSESGSPRLTKIFFRGIPNECGVIISSDTKECGNQTII